MKQMQNQTRAFERRFSRTPVSEGKNARPLITGPRNVSKRIMDQRPLFDKSEVDYIAGRIARAYGQRPDAYPSEGHYS